MRKELKIVIYYRNIVKACHSRRDRMTETISSAGYYLLLSVFFHPVWVINSLINDYIGFMNNYITLRF